MSVFIIFILQKNDLPKPSERLVAESGKHFDAMTVKISRGEKKDANHDGIKKSKQHKPAHHGLETRVSSWAGDHGAA